MAIIALNAFCTVCITHPETYAHTHIRANVIDRDKKYLHLELNNEKSISNLRFL